MYSVPTVAVGVVFPFPTHSAPAPAARSVGVCPIAERLDASPGLLVDLRDRLVVRVQNPDASVSDHDVARSRSELGVSDDPSACRVDCYDLTPDWPWLRPAAGQLDQRRGHDGSEQERRAGNNEPSAAPAPGEGQPWTPPARRAKGRAVRIRCSNSRSSGPGWSPSFSSRSTCPSPVGLERLGLTAGAVQSEHELPAEPLSQWILPDERLQLGDDGTMPSELEIRIEALLERTESQVVQPRDLGLRPGLEPQVSQRLPPKQRQRLPQRRRRGLRGLILAPLDQLFEPVEIELAGSQQEDVAMTSGLDPALSELSA